LKTDPQNTDYALEKGATRNFEPWREERMLNEFIRNMRAQEEEYDPMKALENRTADSKKEIEAMESLDELRTMNARHEKVDVDTALEMVTQKITPEEVKRQEEQDLADQEDEELIRKTFGIKEEVEEDHYVKRLSSDDEGESLNSKIQLASRTEQKKKLPVLVKPKNNAKKPSTSSVAGPSALLALSNYDSD
jgi:hypothetical protein